MKEYNHKKIEKKWQKIWLKEKIYEPNFEKTKNKFYNLMMFPYPSAEGMHVGNMYAFTGADVYGRYKRMQGYDVFEPIGLDGFGIHSENYAIKTNRHPAEQAKISEKKFYEQLQMMGNGFAWNERLETYDPEYYKWTQWIFIQMFKAGLAYRKKASVNWCPSCKTVLADEQVESGKCERCGTEVMKKELEQWFFKITKYAEKLLKNLDVIDWSEKIKIAQREWIGRSEGAEIKFRVLNSKSQVEVFTTRPDTIFGATFLVLAPEHKAISNLKEVENYIKNIKPDSDEKTGVQLKGIMAINPATKKEIPIWVSNYVLSTYGTGAIMAVPAHDERDAEFAKKFNLAFSNAPIVDSDEIIIKIGAKKEVHYHLRDWLISRQRYWGPPIPMIYCDKCQWQPVEEKDLPVLLPKVKNFRPTGTDKSPLATIEKFYKTKCPKCEGPARRETDVSDTFLDSAWYYLRYPSVKNKKLAWDENITKKWCPVDMYIGGAEHSVLHLLYVRFLAMALHDMKLVDFEEPIKKFRAHGLIIKDGAKMSKSKGNVVNPDDYIKNYGVDVLKMYLMFMGPFDQGGDFRDAGIAGITRFLNKIWNLRSKISLSSIPVIEGKDSKKRNLASLENIIHKTIKKVTEDIENLKYNTAISALMILVNELEKEQKLEIRNLELLIKLLAPFAPYITEEIWHQFGNKKSIHISEWPKYDSQKIQEKTFELVVQINGKVRDRFSIPAGIPQKEAEELTMKRENVRKYITGKKLRKIIYIPDRLINIVI